MHQQPSPQRIGTTEFAYVVLQCGILCRHTKSMSLLSNEFRSAVAAALVLAAITTGAHAQTSSASRAPARPPQACHSVTPQTCAIANSLGRGINLGNMLEAPVEGQWGVKLEPAYIDIVAGAFTTVRLPVRWSNNAAKTADATLDEAFAKRVDQVVDALLAKGVYVILDMHHYSQLSGSSLHWNEFPVEAAVLETRLINMWRQIALRYKDRSPKLLFELLNEPTGRLDGEPWNELAPQVLAAVRTAPGRIRHPSRRRHEVTRNLCAHGPRRGGAPGHRLDVLGVRFAVLRHVLAADPYLAGADQARAARLGRITPIASPRRRG
jgi:hypothetical protein